MSIGLAAAEPGATTRIPVGGDDPAERVRAAATQLVDVLAGLAAGAVHHGAGHLPDLLADGSTRLHRVVSGFGRHATRRPLLTAGIFLGLAAFASWLVRRD